jgi:hypothetical protein
MNCMRYGRVGLAIGGCLPTLSSFAMINDDSGASDDK